MKTMVMTIVFGLQGTISKHYFKEHTHRLELDSLNLLDPQKSVLLGTAHILRRVLELSGTRLNVIYTMQQLL